MHRTGEFHLALLVCLIIKFLFLFDNSLVCFIPWVTVEAWTVYVGCLSNCSLIAQNKLVNASYTLTTELATSVAALKRFTEQKAKAVAIDDFETVFDWITTIMINNEG